MNVRICGCALVLICSFAPRVTAQQWLSQLPQNERDQPTINNLQQAFERYHHEHRLDLTREKLESTHRLEGAQEEKEDLDIEEYKMFRRWEWLVEPRAYPTGRLDLQQIATFRGQVKEIDNELASKLPAESLLTKIQSKMFWKPLGPSDAVGGTNMGRVTCIEFDPKNVNTLYLCGADGGVWKSTNGGATWSPKFDVQPTLSVGDIAIDQKNTNVLYVATSDPFGYGVPFWGGTYSVGVMKSIDGGTTWTRTGLDVTVSQNLVIRRLVMNPTDPKILLAATSAGLYRTTDGGDAWTQILSASTYDVEFQQNDGAIVYATTNQVLKSTDAGASFKPLGASCDGTRFNIQIARSNPDVLYTLCTDGNVQRSTDVGATWTVVTAPGALLYGYYDNVLAVSPVDEKIVYVAGRDIKRSKDGGSTWSTVPVAGHVDNHVIKFAPNSSSTLFSGNDGGIFKSTNSGTAWNSLNKGLAITQFYRLGISRTNSNIMVAGAQDNGNIKYASGTFTNITNRDGMGGFIDWSNDRVIYVSTQYGGFFRSTNGGVSFTQIYINNLLSSAWLAPWCQDPSSAKTIYAGAEKIYKSTNQGTTWVAVSGDLAGIDLFTVLKIAQSNPSVIYAGGGLKDPNGRTPHAATKLYRTTSGGGAWSDITAGPPVTSNLLTDVAISETNPDVAYATFSGYVPGQKVYRTSDGGRTWANFSGTLPNMPVDTIAYQKSANNTVYVGTDAGVYYRDDTLHDWVPYKSGLPNVIVDDLQIDYRTKTIRAATFGRGIWQAPLF